MTSFYTSISLLNLKQYDFLHSAPINCIKTTEKYNCPHGEYASARSEYFESHCSKCKHHWKVKRNMKYLDKLLRNHKCLFTSWDLGQPLILFFSNGSVVSLEFNNGSNTLLKIEIDDSLCGKIIQSRIVDVVLCENCFYLTYIEPKLTIVHISQDSPSFFSKIFGRKKGKLVGSEPKIINIDLFVQSSKNLKRKLSLNVKQNLLLIWWKNSNTVRPWTPITHLIKRANILIYSLNNLDIEFVCSMSAQDELLYAIFSKHHPNRFFTLEEVKIENEVTVNICFHEIILGECQLICTEKLPVRGSIITFDWSSNDKLLAADSSGQLLIHDMNKKWNIVTNLEFLPKCLSWHPQNCIALIVCRNNNVMCFDFALNSVGFQLLCKTPSDPKYLKLSSYLHHQFFNQYFVQKIVWQKSVFNDTCLLFLDPQLSSFILLKFSFGWITRHNVSVLELVSQRLKCNEVDLAILLLKSLEWTHNSKAKFQCLSKIAQYLLRKPLDFYTLTWLQMTIGAYYEWVDIIPKKIIELYEDKMHRLGRRFFHHLLRYHQLRKAYLLAVDLGCQDLFLDLYYVAEGCNENNLAFAAFQKAAEGALHLKDPSCCSGCESSASDTNSESTSGSNASYCDPLPQIVPKTVISPFSAFEELGSSHNVANVTPVPSYFQENTLSGISQACIEQYRCKSQFGLPPVLPYSAENSACAIEKEPYISDHLSNRTKINENCSTLEFENIKENPVVYEEDEEVEGTQIKLAHLGII